jgi:nucleotide-binding universal stress UspA family protein
MNAFRTILVPTDFSDTATAALAWAKEIAGKSDGSIEILYADPFLPPPHFTAAQVPTLAEDIERSKVLAEKELTRYVGDHLGEGVRSEAIVAQGLPVTEIVKRAEAKDVDLIVMGTHGRSGFNRMMLGSVTDSVLRQTDRPVLAVRVEEGAAAPVSLRKILCPVNFTGIAQRALEEAFALARLVGAQLTILHVREETDEEGEANEAIDRCLAPIGDTSVKVERVVLEGHADVETVEYARDVGVDLIVLGAQHRRFRDATVLGKTTMHVLRHAHCPVLTVAGGESS